MAVVESEDEAKGPDDLVDVESFHSQSNVVQNRSKRKHLSLLRPPLTEKKCTNLVKEDMRDMVIALVGLCSDMRADRIVSGMAWRLVACYLRVRD